MTKSDVWILDRALPSHRADKRRCRPGKAGIARSLNASWLAARLALAGLSAPGRSLSAALGVSELVSCPLNRMEGCHEADIVGLVTTAMLWNTNDLE